MEKFIFITGGVCSGLGKGITASSIGALLEARGYAVNMMKIDPYLNVDAGTMSPTQHGEVYVTDDGSETDLDLGNYARFTNANLSSQNSLTTGQIYNDVIKKERNGNYLGRTVQVVPHVTREIKERIYKLSHSHSHCINIIEIGGTVGDIESVPYLESVRQITRDLPKENVVVIHLSLIIELDNGNLEKELKTKPTQHSIKELMREGILPDILVCRVSKNLDENTMKKLSNMTGVKKDGIFSSSDVDSLYKAPLMFSDQNIDQYILDLLKLDRKSKNMNEWNKVSQALEKAQKENRLVNIALIGKYIELDDAYKSVDEALRHGGINNSIKVNILKFDSESILNQSHIASIIKDNQIDGIIIPGGFGNRGVDGMIETSKYARENKIPLLGICLGMQVMVMDYARHVLNLEGATSTEFNPQAKYPVISLLEEQEEVMSYGATMRLGLTETYLIENSKIAKAYGETSVKERHRHRYEFSNFYKEDLIKAGLIISGYTKDQKLVEAVEWDSHWGIGVQYHPEFISKPIKPSPLFSAFIKESFNFKKRTR